MGSDSDLEVMQETEKRLDYFGIAYETRIMSAHRTPDKAAEYAATAQQRGLEVIIAGAGAGGSSRRGYRCKHDLAGHRHSH